jgi:calcineurin-like phosphoesterase
MILPKGTAFQSDAGMCGDYHSVIGMEKTEPLRRFVTGMVKERFTPANGEATLSGVYIETDDRTGAATKVVAVRNGGHLAQSGPA